MIRSAVQAARPVPASWHLWTTLLAVGICSLPRIAMALPEAPDGNLSQPFVLPIAGMRPSHCAVPEPASGIRRTYPVPEAHGVYRAFGNSRLMPLGMLVEIGDPSPPDLVGQILFGAATTFRLPDAARLRDGPNPVEKMGFSRQPMVHVYHPSIEQASNGDTNIYRLEMTSSIWEILGSQRSGEVAPVVCLYFHRQSSTQPSHNRAVKRRTPATDDSDVN